MWNVWDKSHDDIDYDHLHEDKKNEWDTWLNDVDARGGIHENSNSLNGSGWQIDYGWSRNRVRNFKNQGIGDSDSRPFKGKEPPKADFDEEKAEKKLLK